MKTAYYRRPEILTQPEFIAGHAVIEASAGTGKTYTLEHLVLDIIIRGKAKIEEVLVVTFTDAATKELRERVRALIDKLCHEEGALAPGDHADDYWAIDDIVRGRLREALFRFDGASISTIHGFCRRVLSEQAFLGGRLFEQEHAEGAETFGFAFREEIRRTLAEDSPRGEMVKLWIEDGQSLSALEQFLYRCHREGCPDRCPVTPRWDPVGFRDAVAAIPPAEELITVGEPFYAGHELHGGFTKIVNDFSAAAAQLSQAASFREARELFLNWAGKERQIKKRKESQLNHLRRMAGLPQAPTPVKEAVKQIENALQTAAGETSFFVYELLPRVQARLSARKRALGLLDYDDMLLGVWEALHTQGAGVLLDALRRRWKFALVDEFQDTDLVQWEIFKKIFVDGPGQHRLIVIGDPKQAIYSFRGADVHTYIAARTYLTQKHGAGRLPLMANYRSTEALIDAVNEILTFGADIEVDDAAEGEAGAGEAVAGAGEAFAGAGEAVAGEAFFDGMNEYREPVECGDKTRIALEEKRPAVPVYLLHLHGGKNKLNAQAVRSGVGNYIGREILRITDKDSGLFVGSGAQPPRALKLNDIYILTRTGLEGLQIGEILRRYGIPHAYYKQEGLYKTAEAADVHNLLCAIDNPQEPSYRMAAWLTPFFGVPLAEMAAWKEAGERHPLVAMLFDWKRLADSHDWNRFFEAIITDSGLVRRLVFAGKERGLTNYLHLFEILLAETHTRPITLAELARGLKARLDGRKIPEGREGDTQRLETDKDAVQILTMHKAKGLQAEVVFIGGGFGDPSGSGIKMNIYHRDDGRRCLHIGDALGAMEQLVRKEISEENQRLMYVALTRAKSRLYLPYFGLVPADGADGADGEDRCYGYSRLGHFYSGLQRQLDRLAQSGRLYDQRRYMVEAVFCSGDPPSGGFAQIAAVDWPQDQLLLEPPPSSLEEVQRIEPGRRGVLLTSYTRMKRGKTWRAPAADGDERSTGRDEEVASEAVNEFADLGEEIMSPAPGTGGQPAPTASLAPGTARQHATPGSPSPPGAGVPQSAPARHLSPAADKDTSQPTPIAPFSSTPSAAIPQPAPTAPLSSTPSAAMPQLAPPVPPASGTGVRHSAQGSPLSSVPSAGAPQPAPFTPVTGEAAELPGGQVAGIFLHSLLEDTPAGEIRALDYREWSSLPAVKQRAAVLLRRHGLAEEHVAEALHMVYTALRSPLWARSRENGDRLHMPDGIAGGERQCKEMAFSYPIPEAVHPLLGSKSYGPVVAVDAGRPAYFVVRGFVQGLIDLVFEHGKKVYMLDWKSNRLSSYEKSALDGYVEENYNLQAQVYALAVVRLLNIRTVEEYEQTFGGIIYAFIRGIEPATGCSDTAGFWFSRPQFKQVVEWEEDLVLRKFWGGDVIQLSNTE